jgi:uncharacterized protein YbjT (DUF2867 family)
MIGIVGGTGLVGRILAKSLIAEGLSVRVIGRHKDEALHRECPQIQFRAADVRDENAIRSALEGCTSIHISLNGGPSANSYREIEAEGVQNIVRAGKNKNWTCITMLSGSSQGFRQPRHISFESKAIAEKSLQTGEAPYCIIRSSFVMEGLERFVRGKRANVLGPCKQRFHWVSGIDLALLVTKIHQEKILLNRTVYAYGPDSLTMREALVQYCKSLYPELKVQGAPFLILEWVGKLTKNAEMVNLVNFLRDLENRGEPDQVENGFALAALVPKSLKNVINGLLEQKLRISPRTTPVFAHN